MATLTIRNLDDAVVENLKARAKANQRSLEAEVRAILASTPRKLSREEALAAFDRIAAMTPKGVKQTDSVELIREGREERMRRFEEIEKENREENARRR
jgi:plasmid stability protein